MPNNLTVHYYECVQMIGINKNSQGQVESFRCQVEIISMSRRVLLLIACHTDEKLRNFWPVEISTSRNRFDKVSHYQKGSCDDAQLMTPRTKLF